jgi:hypothetical protein
MAMFGDVRVWQRAAHANGADRICEESSCVDQKLLQLRQLVWEPRTHVSCELTKHGPDGRARGCARICAMTCSVVMVAYQRPPQAFVRVSTQPNASASGCS